MLKLEERQQCSVYSLCSTLTDEIEAKGMDGDRKQKGRGYGQGLFCLHGLWQDEQEANKFCCMQAPVSAHLFIACPGAADSMPAITFWPCQSSCGRPTPASMRTGFPAQLL